MKSYRTKANPSKQRYNAFRAIAATVSMSIALLTPAHAKVVKHASRPTPQSIALADFLLHYNAKTKKITIKKLADFGRQNAKKLGLSNWVSGKTYASMDDITILNDGVPGSNPPNTVELVTNTIGYDSECPAPYQQNTFCGNVTLRHFFPRALSYVYVQVTSIKDANGNNFPASGAGFHGGLNNAAPAFGLTNTLGLWRHYASGLQYAPAQSIVGASAPYNAGTADWVFANPDNADTYITLRAVAALKYAKYTPNSGNTSIFYDACQSGTKYGPSNTPVATLSPFPFTLYGTTTSVFNAYRNGIITLGSNTPVVNATSYWIPNTYQYAPKPAIFPFWEDITYVPRDPTSQICAGTFGTAPNRIFVVEWKNMQFKNPALNPASLTFEALFYENSDRMVFIYQNMTGANSSVASGATATIGVQNETGTAATSVYHQPSFGSGKFYSLVPQPL